jgi:NAD(P)H-dependent flavin oxidoreductase YrpB (nitropropane dioxygenase family)
MSVAVLSNMPGSQASLRTPLCDLLGCEVPVIQTAMGWVAGASLVVATTNAGGFGSSSASPTTARSA